MLSLLIKVGHHHRRAQQPGAHARPCQGPGRDPRFRHLGDRFHSQGLRHPDGAFPLLTPIHEYRQRQEVSFLLQSMVRFYASLTFLYTRTKDGKILQLGLEYFQIMPPLVVSTWQTLLPSWVVFNLVIPFLRTSSGISTCPLMALPPDRSTMRPTPPQRWQGSSP